MSVPISATSCSAACGLRLFCGERVEQRFDGGVAFGDLLKMELVGGEVLPQ